MKSKKKNRLYRGTALTAVLAAMLVGLAGCGDANVTYTDGTYEGKSQIYTNEDDSEEGNGYGVVTITIKDGAISECEYKTYEPDGTPKDENYGKKNGEIANKDYYNKAQKAVAACDEYASQLVQSGSIKDIDAISGATINYNEFKEAVDDALSQAKAN